MSASPKRAGSLDRALTCLTELDCLPLRDGNERQVADAIPQAACGVFAVASLANPAGIDGLPAERVDALVGADWERLVQAGLAAGAPNPGEVRSGAAVWARICLPWAIDSSTKASLIRLAALAGPAPVLAALTKVQTGGVSARGLTGATGVRSNPRS